MFCTQCGQENSEGARFCGKCGAPIGSDATVGESDTGRHPGSIAAPGVAAASAKGVGSTAIETVRYAGFWYRALALLIDVILSWILMFIIILPLAFILGASMAGSASMQEIEAAGEGLGNFIGLLVGWLYWTIFESSGWQATPGKRMLGLRVTDSEGQRIGFGRANARYWSKILSTLILLIGFLMAAFTRRKQALHDLIASTLVVKH